MFEFFCNFASKMSADVCDTIFWFFFFFNQNVLLSICVQEAGRWECWGRGMTTVCKPEINFWEIVLSLFHI